MTRIIKIVENNHNEYTKPLLEFDDILWNLSNTNQTHDIDELQNLIVKLSQNSTFEIQND